MTKLRGNKARLYIDHEDIYLRSFEMDWGIETTIVDSSVYGDVFDSSEIIRARGRVNLQAYMEDNYRDPADTVDQLSEKFFFGRSIDPTTGLVLATPALVSMVMSQTPAVGDPALFTQGYGNMGTSFPTAGLSVIRFGLQSTGPIHNGKILYMTEVTLDDSAPGTSDIMLGTNVALAAPASVMRAGIHILNFVRNSGTPTVTAKIQSDVTPFSSYTDRLNFASIADEGKEWKEVFGAYTTDTHVRLNLTKVGAGSVTIGLVAIAYTA